MEPLQINEHDAKEILRNVQCMENAEEGARAEFNGLVLVRGPEPTREDPFPDNYWPRFALTRADG